MNLNKHLDWKAITELNRKKRIGLSMNALRYDTVFDKQELYNILMEYQDRLYLIYFELLSHDSAKELDHKLAIWNLKEKIFWKNY